MGVESLTGEYFAGRPVYCKMIDVGSLPNATSKTISTGLENANYVWIDTANSMCFSGGAYYPFPYIDPSNLANAITGRLTNGFLNLVVTTKSNWSGYSCMVVIKYTKK